MLEHLPVLIVYGSGDTLVGLKEAWWNYEAAKGPTELVVIESVSQDPKRIPKNSQNYSTQRNIPRKENEINK